MKNLNFLYRKSLIFGLTITLFACATAMPSNRPVAMRGSFEVRMNVGVKRFSNTPTYPVSAKLVNATPFYQQIIPAGAGIIGLYINKGLSCRIKWTAIILPDNTSITNSNVIANSNCPLWGRVDKDEIITANWN